MKKFGNRQVIDLRKNQKGTTCFKWKALSIEGNKDVFLKYYDGGKLDNCIYNAKGLFQVFPNPFVIIKEGNEYASYDYCGDVMVERRTKENVRTDIIINLEDIINDIEYFIMKGNAPE